MSSNQSFIEILNITSFYLEQGYEDDGVFELFKFAFLKCRGPKLFLNKFGMNNAQLNLNLIQDGIYNLRNDIKNLGLENTDIEKIKFHNVQVSKLLTI